MGSKTHYLLRRRVAASKRLFVAHALQRASLLQSEPAEPLFTGHQEQENKAQ